VTACGLVGGIDLPMTVFPFILRGVTLQGIDSARVAMERRAKIWKKLAGPWRIKNLPNMQETVTLQTLSPAIRKILDGKVVGRILVDLRS
jgi:NADPH:quinone reductase-like Zn-dependent oxidoreductase